MAFCDDDDAWFPGVGRGRRRLPRRAPRRGGRLVVARRAPRRQRRRGRLPRPARVREHASCCGRTSWRSPSPWCAARALASTSRSTPTSPPARTGTCGCGARRRACAHRAHVGYLYTQHGGSRVTRTAESQITGRRNFLAKHGAAMTGACRLFHETVLAGYEAGPARHGARPGPVGGASVPGRSLGRLPPGIELRRRPGGAAASGPRAPVAPHGVVAGSGCRRRLWPRTGGDLAPRIVGEGRRCVAVGAARRPAGLTATPASCVPAAPGTRRRRRCCTPGSSPTASCRASGPAFFDGSTVASHARTGSFLLIAEAEGPPSGSSPGRWPSAGCTGAFSCATVWRPS